MTKKPKPRDPLIELLQPVLDEIMREHDPRRRHILERAPRRARRRSSQGGRGVQNP